MSLRYRRMVFDIEEKPSILNKKPSISTRYSKFACLCHLISGPISKVFIRYRSKDLRYLRFYSSLPPDIEGLYSISVAISNISREISSIYRYWAPSSNHFHLILNVSSINIFHILISCTICDADIGLIWVRYCAYLLSVPAKFQNLKLRLVSSLWSRVDSSSSHKVLTG